MLPYPPLYAKEEAGDNSLLRVLGGVLALLSIVLALLGIIFHQGVADLVIGVLVGIFGLRVLILWLADKAQSQHDVAMQQPYLNPAKYPTRSSPYAQQYMRQPAPYVGRYEHPPISYTAPYSRAQSFYQERTQAIQPPMPIALAQAISTPPRLPRSVRPQRSPIPEAPFPTRFIEPIEPVQPPHIEQQGETRQPVSEWLTPADASVPVLLPAPRPQPDQTAHWQYDDGSDFAQQQGSREEMSDYGTA